MTRKEPATVFGRRLRAARQRADIPQDRLGVQIGLDESTASARMSRYETGTHAPPFGIAVKLAQALHLPTAYFYCEDDELADLVLAWVRLPKTERKHIKAMIDAILAGKRTR
ncbi:XRE family transcriptional regulator [Burkholderia pseudomallei]|nr:XRE family transcriptional regulator [Burkholderia pseudomallei]